MTSESKRCVHRQAACSEIEYSDLVDMHEEDTVDMHDDDMSQGRAGNEQETHPLASRASCSIYSHHASWSCALNLVGKALRGSARSRYLRQPWACASAPIAALSLATRCPRTNGCRMKVPVGVLPSWHAAWTHWQSSSRPRRCWLASKP